VFHLHVDDTRGGSRVRAHGQGGRLDPGVLRRDCQFHDHGFAAGGDASEHITAEPTIEPTATFKSH
jgi:hypothetical protein